MSRPMRFVTLETGCYVCLSHKLNHDGYLRKGWGVPNAGLEMFHRFIYRAHHGEIPDGYEIDHTCNVRACCNPDHLRAMPGLDHAIHTNKTRYADRKDAARTFWEETPVTGTALAEKFGVSFGAGCKWIREWKMAA